MLADTTPSPRFVLRTVTLERFKTAFRPDPINLRPFNVLIGRNGSGKSTLLEALQWLDTTMRIDARAASDRYFGVRDLINLRSESDKFRIRLGFSPDDAPNDDDRLVSYDVKVKSEDDGTPHIEEERLWVGPAGRKDFYIKQNPSKGGRVLCGRTGRAEMPFSEPDRLALSRGGMALELALREFFRDWVFLRLSPSRLAKGSPARRKSFEPLLDEEGQNLPALLYELNESQREDLISRVRQVLPGMRDVHLDESHGRDTIVNYALLERQSV